MPEQDRDNQLIAAWLADRDAPCPKCGYSLRGWTPTAGAPRCPECEQPIELQLTGTESVLGPWLLAYTSCAMGFGFDLVMAAFFFLVVVLQSGGGTVTEGLVLLAMMITLAVASGVAMTRLRDRAASWAQLATLAQWQRAWAWFFAVFFVHLFTAIGFALWQIWR